MPFIPEDTNGCKQSTGLLMCPCVPSMRPIASNISIKQQDTPHCVLQLLYGITMTRSLIRPIHYAANSFMTQKK